MNETTKTRLRELMFYVVPDPDEDVTDEVMEKTGKIDYDKSIVLKAEFRTIIESLDARPRVRRVVLEALDDIYDLENETPIIVVEWVNTI